MSEVCVTNFFLCPLVRIHSSGQGIQGDSGLQRLPYQCLPRRLVEQGSRRECMLSENSGLGSTSVIHGISSQSGEIRTNSNPEICVPQGFYNLETFQVFPSQKRIDKIQAKSQSFLANKQQMARSWMFITGLRQAITSQVDVVCLRLRPLHWQLNQFWNRSHSIMTKIPLDQKSKESLLWWTQEKVLKAGFPFHRPKPQVTVFTDASVEGWGAHCQNQEIQGSCLFKRNFFT